MIRHVLIIRFKPDAAPSAIEQVLAAFLSLQQQIPGILAVEWGTNNSPEGKAGGFSHCVLMTFEDEAARDAYLPHPQHAAFKDLFRPVLEDILVLDYVPVCS